MRPRVLGATRIPRRAREQTRIEARCPSRRSPSRRRKCGFHAGSGVPVPLGDSDGGGHLTAHRGRSGTEITLDARTLVVSRCVSRQNLLFTLSLALAGDRSRDQAWRNRSRGRHPDRRGGHRLRLDCVLPFRRAASPALRGPVLFPDPRDRPRQSSGDRIEHRGESGRLRYAIYRGSRQDWARDWDIKRNEPLVANVLRAQDCHLSGDKIPPVGMTDLCLARSKTFSGHTLFAIGDSHSYANWNMATAGVTAGAYDLYAYFSRCLCGIRDGGASPGDSCDEYWRYVHGLLSERARKGDLVLLSTYFRAYDAFNLPDEQRRDEAATRVEQVDPNARPDSG